MIISSTPSKELYNKFISAGPVPMLVLDNFADTSTVQSLNLEITSLDDSAWKVFTRNGSYMKELNELTNCPAAFSFVSHMHSSKTVKWLEEITGIPYLVPDPHLIGAGYSKSFNGDCLKIHSDFNWNDQIKLHRALSFVLYLTPDWKSEYNGALNFYDSKQETIVTSVDYVYNRAIIWKHHERGFHGFDQPLDCPSTISRNTFRLFYYTSDLEPIDAHRSLYWYDQTKHLPYDLR